MKKYTTTQLSNIKQCNFQGFMSTFNTFNESGKFLHLLQLTKNVIMHGEIDLGKYFDESVDEKYFYSNKELLISKNLFMTNIERFQKYLQSENGEIIAGKGEYLSDYLECTITVKYDLVIEYPDRIEAIKLKNSPPKLSYKARNEANKVENNLELFMLQLATTDMYADKHKKCYGAFYHLKGKEDKSSDYKLLLKGEKKGVAEELLSLENERNAFYTLGKKREGNKINTIIKKLLSVIYFDGSPGSHILKCDSFDSKYIHEEIGDLIGKELNIHSEKTKGSHCDLCQYATLCKAKEFVKVDLEEIEECAGKSKSETKPTTRQMEIINFDEGIARVNASSGSGKTTTIALRSKRLIEETSTKAILNITFSNKGAEELTSKINALMDAEYDLNVYTFNSYGSMILSLEYERLGFTEPPIVVDKNTKVDILLNLLKEEEYNNIEWLNFSSPLLNMMNAKGVIYQLFETFNYKKSFGNYGDKYKDDENKVLILDKLFYEFNSRMWATNKLDYQDQLLLTVKLFAENPKLIQKYGFNHISVDEGQDTDLLQITLIKQLMMYKHFKSFILVGDTSQSIYGFRNTTPEYMINFKHYFGSFYNINLVDNFRSTTQICELGNGLDKLGLERVDKDMISFKGMGAEVELVESDTSDGEYLDIYEKIKGRIANKVNYQDIAIIARTKKELLEINSLLNSKGIPNILDIPSMNMDNHNIRLAINLAKYMVDRKNEQYLLEYIAYIKPELNTEGELKAKLEESRIGLEKIILAGIETINENNSKMDDTDTLSIAGKLGSEVEEISLDVYLSLIKVLRKDKICDNFITDCLEARPFSTISELSSYLSKFVVYNDDSQAVKDDIKYKAVVLTTAHSSKGKEWDTVFVVLDKFQYKKLKVVKDLDEERRLLFVAVTRAKEKLYLPYNTKQDKKRGKGSYCGFVDEIEEILKSEGAND